MSRVSPAFRMQVRQRAAMRCEYCRKPEFTSAHGFHADHIIPPRHGGSSALDNLAWACFECNTTKSVDIASYDFETSVLTPLYNPRTQRWEDHFAMDEEFIIAKTPIGRVTIRILDMNHPAQLETRRNLIDIGLW